MKYTCEDNLTNFKFWSGAADRVKDLTYGELNRLDDILPEYFGYRELPSDTDINDMFWFDFATVCHALGYAYMDGTIVRDIDDIPEDVRLEKLKEYLDGEGWKYTEEQLKKMDQILLENETYKIDVENDDIDDSELYLLESEAQEAGIVTDEEE